MRQVGRAAGAVGDVVWCVKAEVVVYEALGRAGCVVGVALGAVCPEERQLRIGVFVHPAVTLAPVDRARNGRPVGARQVLHVGQTRAVVREAGGARRVAVGVHHGAVVLGFAQVGRQDPEPFVDRRRGREGRRRGRLARGAVEVQDVDDVRRDENPRRGVLVVLPPVYAEERALGPGWPGFCGGTACRWRSARGPPTRRRWGCPSRRAGCAARRPRTSGRRRRARRCRRGPRLTDHCALTRAQ